MARYAPGVLLGNFSRTVASYKIIKVDGDKILTRCLHHEGEDYWHDRAYLRKWYRVMPVDKTESKFTEMFL